MDLFYKEARNAGIDRVFTVKCSWFHGFLIKMLLIY